MRNYTTLLPLSSPERLAPYVILRLYHRLLWTGRPSATCGLEAGILSGF